MNLITRTHLRATVTLLLGLLITLQPLTVHAFDAPWDQGHRTTRPDPAPRPGPPDGPDCGNSTSSPVYTATGDFVWHETDIVIPGRQPLVLRRSYNSHDPRDGIFGKGWSTGCEPQLIKVHGSSSIVAAASGTGEFAQIAYMLIESNGRRHGYSLGANGDIIPPKWRFDRIEPQADGTVKLINRNGSYRRFDAHGRLIQRVDRNGNALTYQRDEQGRLVRLSDGHGRHIDLAYDSTGHVASATDHSGRRWQYAYNADGALTSVTDPAGNSRQYRYQGAETIDFIGGGQAGVRTSVTSYQQLTGITDESGREILSVSYVTDSNGTPQRRVESYTTHGVTWNYRHSFQESTRTHTVIKTDAAGHRWTYSIDRPDGQIGSERDPANGIQRWQYNEHSLLTHYTDANGSAWQYSYDAQGRKLSATDPLGRTTTWTYTGDQPWPATITRPGGRVTQLEYDPHGNPTRITDPAGNTTQLAYNAQGDLIALTDASGHRSEIRYNAAGQPTQYQDPLGRITRMEYDSLGRLIKTTHPGGDIEQIGYDQLDRIQTRTDGLGRVTRYRHDPAGRLLSVTDPRGNIIGQYQYDNHGRLASATEAGIDYQYNYNPDGTLASLVQGDITHSYQYDNRHLPTRATTTDGITITQSHDPAGRLTRISGGSANISLDYRYNSAGELTRITAARRSISLGYNDQGQLETWQGAGQTTQYQYAPTGLLTRITTDAGDYRLSRDPRGYITELQHPYGQWRRQYDSAGQLTAQDYSQSGGVSYQYQYDADSRLIQATGSQNRRYQYDAADQLTGALHDSDSYSYRYDPAGNRTEHSQRHDPANRLSEDADYQYQYDARGNLIRKTHKTSGAYTTYRYNGLNRLIDIADYPDASATTPTRSASYRYDPLGRRVQKTVAGLTTDYQWLGNRLIAEYQGSQQTVTYSYGEGHAPIAVSDGSDTWIVHSDHLGTPRQLSDASGRIVWQNRPTPYGISQIDEDPDGDGNTVTFNLRFPGQYYDAESGLHYNYFRYYDSNTGRYITHDPLGVLPGLTPTPNLPKEISDYYQSFSTQQVVSRGLNHTYAYVESNPLNAIDPLGLNQMNHGPVGERGCRTTCITNYIGGGLLAAGAGLGFGAIAGSGWVAGTIGYAGSTANAIYSNFSLAACLDSCNDDDDDCK